MTPIKYQLRPANRSDAHAIRNLVRDVGINPFGLDWRRFILAVDLQGQVIGCGQVKVHRDGSRELASIAVHPSWRRRGVARAIIERLLDESPGRLYLTCRERLGKFYARFGFHRIERQEMPRYFSFISLMAALLKRVGLFKEGLLVMMRPEQKK